MTENNEFAWFELRPQQNFKDDKENKIFEIIRYAPEFAFFIFRKNSTMRIVVRTQADQASLFHTVIDMSAVPCKKPQFEQMVTKCLSLKNKGSMVPLVDLKTVTKSNMYQKMWKERRDSMMACYVYNVTEKALGKINAKISRLENEKKTREVPLSSKKNTELAAGIQKRDGHHAYHSCCIVLGMEKEEAISGDNEEIRYSTKLLDKMIDSILDKSFAHRVSRRRIRFSSEKKSFLERVLELFGAGNKIDPYTFVSKKMRSKSMVLTETEIAYFISFPQEHDIQTINFEMGSTPTFTHGKTEDIEKTDLDIQGNCKDLPDDNEDQD